MKKNSPALMLILAGGAVALWLYAQSLKSNTEKTEFTKENERQNELLNQESINTQPPVDNGGIIDTLHHATDYTASYFIQELGKLGHLLDSALFGVTGFTFYGETPQLPTIDVGEGFSGGGLGGGGGDGW